MSDNDEAINLSESTLDVPMKRLTQNSGFSTNQVLTILISIIALIFSALGYFGSKAALSEAVEANKIAESSLKTAESANIISLEANVLAKQSNDISKEMANLSVRAFELEEERTGASFTPIWKTQTNKKHVKFDSLIGGGEVQKISIIPPYGHTGFLESSEFPFSAELDGLDFQAMIKADVSLYLDRVKVGESIIFDCPVLIITDYISLGNKKLDFSIYDLSMEIKKSDGLNRANIVLQNFSFDRRLTSEIGTIGITKIWSETLSTYPNSDLNLGYITVTQTTD